MSHECPICNFSTDDAAEMFAHVAGKDWRTDYQLHGGGGTPERIVDALGFKYSDGFPDAMGSFDFGGLDVEIKPVKRGELVDRGPYARPYRKKSAAHRVFVVCPTCSKKIPAGRMRQHLIVHSTKTKVCEVCGKGYGTHNHLRTHMRLQHGAAR